MDLCVKLLSGRVFRRQQNQNKRPNTIERLHEVAVAAGVALRSRQWEMAPLLAHEILYAFPLRFSLHRFAQPKWTKQHGSSVFFFFYFFDWFSSVCIDVTRCNVWCKGRRTKTKLWNRIKNSYPSPVLGVLTELRQHVLFGSHILYIIFFGFAPRRAAQTNLFSISRDLYSIDTEREIRV